MLRNLKKYLKALFVVFTLIILAAGCKSGGKTPEENTALIPDSTSLISETDIPETNETYPAAESEYPKPERASAKSKSEWNGHTMYDKYNKHLELSEGKNLTAENLTGILQGKDIESLEITGTDLNDLSPLSELTSLKALRLNENRISDISPLMNLTLISELDLSKNEINDINALKEMKLLTILKLNDNKISDISPLENLNSLVNIELSDNKISDISPFAGLSSLETIWLKNNNITDLTPMVDSKSLNYIYLFGNPVSDYEPLLKIPSLIYPGVDKYKAESNPFDKISLPDNLEKWQVEYYNYLKEHYKHDFLPHSIYVKDINSDDIPEVFLYTMGSWIYPQSVLTHTENGIAVTNLAIFSGSLEAGRFVYYIPETGQIVLKETGHLVSQLGILEYYIFDSTPEGYINTINLQGSIDGYFVDTYNYFARSDPDNDEEQYETIYYKDLRECRINDEEVTYEEFTEAVDKYITPYALEDFSIEMICANTMETAEYLKESLFYSVTE